MITWAEATFCFVFSHFTPQRISAWIAFQSFFPESLSLKLWQKQKLPLHCAESCLAASLHDSGCTEASVTRRRVLFNAIVIIYGVCLQFDSETARWLTALRPPSNRNCAYGDPGMKPVRNKNRKSNKKLDASAWVLLRSLTVARERFDIAFFVGDWVWQ